MNEQELKQKLQDIRKKAYELGGGYQESYEYLMNELDEIIISMKGGQRT